MEAENAENPVEAPPTQDKSPRPSGAVSITETPPVDGEEVKPDIKEPQLPRRNAIPILYTRGTHYEVGFDVGRNFASIIKSFLSISGPLNNSYLPLYETELGQRAYNETLEIVREQFPQYIRELEGVADGAQVEFHKLFLLHMDEILPQSLKFQYVIENEIPDNASKKSTTESISAGAVPRTSGQTPRTSAASVPDQSTPAPEGEPREAATGCSSLILNLRTCRVIAHTEDALAETLNHFYFVNAHIIEDSPQGKHNVVEERFMSLCYAGHLPGYTMGYNFHGLVFTINTLSATKLRAGKTPRHFLTRALLSAENYQQAINILKDTGVGAGDGCSVNLAFVSPACSGKPNTCYNIELKPAAEEGETETKLNIREVIDGQCCFHANKYERESVEEDNELMLESSCQRMQTFFSRKPPKNIKEIVEIMGEDANGVNSIFRASNAEDEFVKTICFGIFDLNTRTGNFYTDNPRFNEPIMSIPFVLKKC